MKSVKLLLLSFCITLFFTSCAKESQPISPSIESNELILYADTVQASPGETTQVAIRIQNNPGILGMTLSVHFDESKCQLVDVKNGDALDVLHLTPSKQLENGARFLWDGLELSDDEIQDGKVLIMEFKISNEAEGYCPITVKTLSGDIFDRHLNVISPLVQSGEIIIKERN